MSKLIDAAREFLKENAYSDSHIEYFVHSYAAFAEQQIALAVAEERKRLLKELSLFNYDSRERDATFDNWLEKEFAKEIGETDGTDGD